MKPPQFTVRRLMLCVLLSACYFAGIMSRRAVVARLGASLQRSRHEIMDLQQQLAAAKLGAIGRQIDKELMEVMELKKRLESDLDLVRTVDKGSSVEQGTVKGRQNAKVETGNPVRAPMAVCRG